MVNDNQGALDQSTVLIAGKVNIGSDNQLENEKSGLVNGDGGAGGASTMSDEEMPTNSTPKDFNTVSLTQTNNDCSTKNIEKKLDYDDNQVPNQGSDNCEGNNGNEIGLAACKPRAMSIDELNSRNIENDKKQHQLNKELMHFKSLDIDIAQTKYDKINLATEYFNAQKKGREESKSAKQQAPFIVLDLKDENKNDDKKQEQPKQNPNILFKLGKKFSIDLNNNTELEEWKKKKLEEENFNADEDNILGYMKMYKKHAKVSAQTIGDDQMWRLKVLIDGPYGTPSQSIFDAEHAVLVAAGIGITPFASILQSLMYRYRRAKATCPSCDCKLGEEFICDEKLAVRKVDFIWITRDQRSLEWFISMLSQMEIEQAKTGDNFLETHLYVTSAKRQSDLRSIGLHLTLDAICSQEQSHLIDGLKKRTHFGRPNWDIVLQGLIRKQKGKLNMFYCGPPNLCNVLSKKCNEYNIIFKKEVF
jgi:hypothetical protein